jgi:hypothetical protein
MADLSHWDFAHVFHGDEAAALMLGLDPIESASETRIRVVRQRLHYDYARALQQAQAETSAYRSESSTRPSGLLISYKLERLWRDALAGKGAPLDDWTFDKEQSLFEAQVFSRRDIVTWLSESGMKSAYPFELAHGLAPVDGDQVDIDPADFPEELQAANIAFRAVSNGFGDRAATFKNRLVAYLKKNYPALTSEAVTRISTVANPDKVRGRKKLQA